MTTLKMARPRALDNLSILVALLAVCFQVHASCPPRWDLNPANDMCYYAGIHGTFDDIFSSCKHKGGTMISSLRRSELRTATNIHHVGRKYVWVGIEDKGNGEGLKLLNGQPVPDSLDWTDDKKPEISTTRMCGYIDENLQLTLTKKCDQDFFGICERKPVSCPDHWYHIAGDCMRVFTDKKSWGDANQACKDMKASPMMIPTAEHAMAVFDYLKIEEIEHVSEVWSGAKGSEWDDGSIISDFSAPHLFKHRRKGVGATGCGYLSPSKSRLVLTSTEACKVHRNYACFLKGDSPEPETLPSLNPNVCSDGFTVIGDKCFWKSVDPATWRGAKDLCDGKDAKLFIAPTEDDQFDLLEILDGDLYWVGLSRDSNQDQFKWTDGSNQEELESNPNFNGNCGFASSGSDHVKIYPQDCGEKILFICQKDQDKNAPNLTTPKPPEVSQGNCGDGWEERPGTDTCYSFIDKTNDLYSRAYKLCERKGGHLVSINSLDEEVYLSGRLAYMTSSIFWIGVYNHYKFSGWSWMDGSPFAYLGWAAGQPSFDAPADGYVSRTDMKWRLAIPGWHLDNTRDEYYAGAICEKHLSDHQPSALAPPKPQAGKYYECDEHWYGYENSCYFFSTSKNTWLEARAKCLRHDADLASIENTEVNDFIHSILPAGCVDSDPKCEERNAEGDCTNKPFLMGRLCPKTCNFCNESCEDSIGTQDCKTKAIVGWCNRQPSFREKCQLSCGCDASSEEGYWIGLNAQQFVQQYEWSDKSQITYTTWSENEPDNYEGKGEKCVLMHRPTGQWSDKSCDTKSSGFICEKPKSFKEEEIEDPSTVGCPAGAQGHEDKCYTFVDEKVEWSVAKKNCETKYQRLAILSDNVINEFVAAQLFAHQILVAWIGLHHNEGTPKWVDGSVPTYMAKFETKDLSDDQCGAAADTGQWGSYDCRDVKSYVCESHRDGYTSPAPTEPPSPMEPAPCPGGWTAFKDKCFKIFSEYKTWNRASHICNGHGGSLASIPDQETTDVIVGINGAAYLRMWIGLIREDDGQGFVWSDGTAYIHHYWGKDEPDEFLPNPICTLIEMDGSWSAYGCETTQAFMCQVSRGQGFYKPDTTPFISPIKFCEETDKNGDKWREFGGKCYHVNPLPFNWWEARKKCAEKDADLVSIHSRHEKDFLIELVNAEDEHWIGFHELGLQSYEWTDRTPSDYFHWPDGEPNDAGGEEKCVTMQGGNAGWWNDANCLNKYMSICKKREGTMPPPTLPTEVKGVCPDGFKSERFSNRCYYFSGDDQAESWIEAHKACQDKQKRAELATIGGSIDQAFVTLLIEESNSPDIWIGFNAREDRDAWNWIDNSVNSFTHWDLNRPGSRWDRPYGHDCAVVQRITKRVNSIGTWDRNMCIWKNPYLCQALRVPGSEEDKNPFEDQYSAAQCAGDDSFLYHGRCYTFYSDKKTWAEARKFCKNKGKDLKLPVPMDTFEGARLNYESYLNGEHTEFWTDVWYNKDLYKYVWGKDRDVHVTPWDSDEPDQPLEDSCVAFLDGFWFNEPCSAEKPFFCVEGDYNGDDPSKPDPSDLHCESPNDEPYGNKCYWIPETETDTWSGAREHCKTKGMTLASIHSLDEAKFINDLLEKTRKDKKNAWIGFESGSTGAFRWSDGSAVNFLYWDQFKWSQSSSAMHWDLWWPGGQKDCVEMMLSNDGKWNNLVCSRPLAYVCSKNKVTAKSDAEEPTKSDTEEPIKSDTDTPTKSDTDTPTKSDTDTPTKSDTKEPTKSDTEEPTKSDTKEPTKSDTKEPTKSDTDTPTKSDTDTPTKSDTEEPTKSDTDTPTKSDTKEPTKSDTDTPTKSDTEEPTKSDTEEPTKSDTKEHTKSDTKEVATEEPVKFDQGDNNTGASKDDGKTGQLSGGAIAGIVLGVLTVLALVLVAVFIVRKRLPLWHQKSVLRGNLYSDKVVFDNTINMQGGDDTKDLVDFFQTTA